MSTAHNVPQGDLVLRTLAMPADTNANGDIFGGWLMSQMDIGGAILAKEIAHGRVVTVRVEGMTFLRPVAVGDVVKVGQRLMVLEAMKMENSITPDHPGTVKHVLVAEGDTVAVDSQLVEIE